MIKRIIELESRIFKREEQRRKITNRALKRYQMLTEFEIRTIAELESDNLRDQAEVRHIWQKLAE